MQRERAEVIWEVLSILQRFTLINALGQGFVTSGVEKKSWSEIDPRIQKRFLDFDWEFMLGQKFPQLNQK